MPNYWRSRDTTALTDEQYQEYILPAVSRTFALTIPPLPEALRNPVATAYLLCRIADTIEDEPGLSVDQKSAFADAFVAVVNGAVSPERFAVDLAGALSGHGNAAERDLIRNTVRVIRVLNRFGATQRVAISRCVAVMAKGMVYFQAHKNPLGLKNLSELDSYCYHVAGVVGEMLTELYCDYSVEVRQHRPELLRLSVSFGQGLQMTNILKDYWEDRRRGACWLPQDVFFQAGCDAQTLDHAAPHAAFRDALGTLLGIAHWHLQNGLAYTLMIPRSERALRKFCFWALGMALLTLRKINDNRAYTSVADAKISRRSVRAVSCLANLVLGSDAPSRWLFAALARGLPLRDPASFAALASKSTPSVHSPARQASNHELPVRRSAP